jgi:NAD(P)-dependent dehydrogenase (short-subunit alcohol dehydrogenase family)
MAETNDTKPSVLIGGISGGVGASLAGRFLKDGWQVGGYGRSEEKLRTFVETHPDATTYQADATDPAQVDQVFEKWLERAGGLDAYVHCIGSILLKPAHGCSDEEFEETLSLNLRSAFYALRAAVRPMQKAKGGSILFVSTVAAQVGVPNHEPIAAAKAGVDGLVRSAASTYATKNVRVNAVAPGMVETPMAKPLLGSDQAKKLSAAMHPLGRTGQADDISSLLHWLAQPENDWVTGQIWSVDGGMAHVRQRTKV